MRANHAQTTSATVRRLIGVAILVLAIICVRQAGAETLGAAKVVHHG